MPEETLINSSNIPSRFISFSLVFMTLTISSWGPPQQVKAIRSPTERVMKAAAMDSSQQAKVKGDISPIKTPSSSKTATAV